MREYRIIQRGDGRYMAQTKGWLFWHSLGPPEWCQSPEEAREIIEINRECRLPYKVVLEFEA